jgi:phosphate transport system permease protein
MPGERFMKLEAAAEVARPPSRGQRIADRLFRGSTRVLTWLVVLLSAYIIWEIGGNALPAIRDYGFGFLTGTEWDPNTGRFGVLPQIWGTIYSSLLALIMAGTVGVMIAIFLTQGFLPYRVEIVFRYVVELLAAVPSVVYGLWGIHVVIPLLRPLAEWLHSEFGVVPFFSTTLSGPGMFPAALVLAIMVLPTVAAISQDALRAVPHKMKEAVYGMGATRWQAILRVIVPAASSSIFGAMVLGLGRALGETMALAMLVGNSNQITLSLFSPANSLAAALALNFPEAGVVEAQALMYSALVLLAITLMVNIIGAGIIGRASRKLEGAQ